MTGHTYIVDHGLAVDDCTAELVQRATETSQSPSQLVLPKGDRQAVSWSCEPDVAAEDAHRHVSVLDVVQVRGTSTF